MRSGICQVSRDGAVLFFQLINQRYEHASAVLTSNKSFEEWSTILDDEVMAGALIDRLMHHCHVGNMRGNKHRMREHAVPDTVVDAEERRLRRTEVRDLTLKRAIFGRRRHYYTRFLIPRAQALALACHARHQPFSFTDLPANTVQGA